ncbi:MAG: GIY-YIG nuclease family protein [bacterium]|nr:GIY-YIG nuclease family protein [bacterium]
MYFVHLLQSEKDQTFYVGQTSGIDYRLAEHNGGKVYYTSRKKPYRLVYYEAYQTREAAVERERQLKRFGSTYVGLLKRLGLKEVAIF